MTLCKRAGCCLICPSDRDIFATDVTKFRKIAVPVVRRTSVFAPKVGATHPFLCVASLATTILEPCGIGSCDMFAAPTFADQDRRSVFRVRFRRAGVLVGFFIAFCPAIIVIPARDNPGILIGKSQLPPMSKPSVRHAPRVVDFVEVGQCASSP